MDISSQKDKNSNARLIFYVFLFALLVRLPVGFWLTNVFGSDYAIIAGNLARGTGYSLDGIHPTAFRTPVYPLFLAGIIALFGEQRVPVVMLLSFVGAINAGLCAWLGIKIFSRSVGLVAGLLYTIIPYLVQKESTTEGGFVTLGLLGGLCLLQAGLKNKRLIQIGLAGFMFAFAYLVRPTIGLIPVFVSISLLAGLGKTRKPSWHIVSAVILIVVFAIGIFPWAARNKKVFGRWYFGQTNFWHNVYIGNHRLSFDIYPYLSLDNFMPMVRPQVNRSSITNEFKRELSLKQMALTEIKNSNPRDIISKCLYRFLYMWNIRLVPYTDRLGNDALTGRTLDRKRSIFKNMVFSIPYLFLFIFALLGAWQERKRPQLLLFIAGFLFFFSIPYMLTIAYPRYTTQVYFVLILLAARGLVSILHLKSKYLDI